MNTTNESLIACLRLVRDRRWSLRQKNALLARYATPQVILGQSTAALKKVVTGQWSAPTAGYSERDIQRDLDWLQHPDRYLLQPHDGQFPPLLKRISDPPIALFASGDIKCLLDPQIAIVGSRRPGSSGVQITRTLAQELAALGIVISSGMALGIDGIAHEAALSVGGKTVAVMGCGLDTVYPRRHLSLFDKIQQHGCVLSEFPLGTPVSRYTFPQRNRIVSGIAQGVIIVEAAERSGTLITAKLATEQDRSVMVVPGPVLNPQYLGSHRLIQQGAALVVDSQDVLNELQVPLQSALKASVCQAGDRGPYHDLLQQIDWEPMSIDSIITASGLTAAEVSSMLLTLEIKGKIALNAEGLYVRIQ
jgi:DNA processing protein